MGLQVLRQTKTELEMRCPWHSDKRPSFYVNIETGAWICHAGCGRGSFLQLYEKLQRVSDIAHRDSPSPATDEAYQSVDLALSFLVKRGFTPAMLNRWGVVYSEDYKAAELPCFDDDRKWFGSIYRMAPGLLPKYRHPEGFPRSRVLFGLWRLPRVLPEVWLTEGPLDAIWLQEAGYPAVAMLGSYLTKEQVAVLSVRGVTRVTLCFDNDDAGRVATVLASKTFRQEGVWAQRINLPTCYKDIQEVPWKKIQQVVSMRSMCSSASLPLTLGRWLANEERSLA